MRLFRVYTLDGRACVVWVCALAFGCSGSADSGSPPEPANVASELRVVVEDEQGYGLSCSQENRPLTESDLASLQGTFQTKEVTIYGAPHFESCADKRSISGAEGTGIAPFIRIQASEGEYGLLSNPDIKPVELNDEGCTSRTCEEVVDSGLSLSKNLELATELYARGNRFDSPTTSRGNFAEHSCASVTRNEAVYVDDAGELVIESTELIELFDLDMDECNNSEELNSNPAVTPPEAGGACGAREPVCHYARKVVLKRVE